MGIYDPIDLLGLVVKLHLANWPDGAHVLGVGWVAFSLHDETGDDLRRRSGDPDITWVDHTHPVVYAGAGSHPGAYLPDEYLVRVDRRRCTHLRRSAEPVRCFSCGQGIGQFDRSAVGCAPG